MIRVALFALLALSAALARAEDYVVTFREPTSEAGPALATPVDPNPRIQYQGVGQMSFGLTVDNKHNLCCGPGAIRTTFKVDEQILHPNQPNVKYAPLLLDRNGRMRRGIRASYTANGVQFTQEIEVVPGRAKPGEKRFLDTVLVRYLVENRDLKPKNVGIRVRMDAMCGDNDGALFAAPTHPKEILDGVELKGKTLPDHVRILERPDLNDPGFVGIFTLKMPPGRIGPDRFLCTAHAIGDNGWDTPTIKANGDSDCVLMWSPRTLKPGEKVEFAYGYGRSLATFPEPEGRVRLTLGGSFEPGKRFVVQALVEEPVLGQWLRLDLPSGMSLIEGGALQPAPAISEDQPYGMALWKARVDRPGVYTLRLTSSTGAVESRTVSIEKRSTP